MERIALLVDDADHARHLLAQSAPSGAEVHWVVVAFPPMPARYLGRWASRSAREQWCQRWVAELKGQLDPILAAHAGHRVEHLLASGTPDELRMRLEARLPGLRLIDARRPPRVAPAEPAPVRAPAGILGWFGPVLVTTGLGLTLGLVD